MLKKYSYNKKEKLKSKKLLDEVFKKGKTFSIYPVKVFYLVTNDELESNNHLKTGVGVSKRYFKQAKKRNYIKRVLRECYRQNKLPLVDHLKNNKKHLALFFLYTDKEVLSFIEIEKRVKNILDKLQQQLN
ncbi:MAG TPA: ribonuclease P protein component [Chitinophagaceae bacterium]|nr:ribonuclease P protein component [Chitinophagaceae bacterium]HMZ45699.1 ribonuclease P protein component [Chitinophagaceae bacterium]HNM34855.1 ribonuclease P protein component [Chitinophagaceae bacterium]